MVKESSYAPEDRLLRAILGTQVPHITRSISVSLMIYIITQTSISSAYPIFAQQGYENPQLIGRIVCANCHLANKPMDIEVPQAVLPDTVFEAIVRIPYDMQSKQVLANGKKYVSLKY
ncbi:Cytochrome f [Camellia lanceoleosa]|uniref:Cytochrome f n=1 Tax=Camellia lanceoleosa TaxID=1840588 RepID=A0ACC0HGN1_9ERIC|nr:Cytochrome f [Camellia lanceoleosa]